MEMIGRVGGNENEEILLPKPSELLLGALAQKLLVGSAVEASGRSGGGSRKAKEWFLALSRLTKEKTTAT